MILFLKREFLAQMAIPMTSTNIYIFKILFIFRERGREGDREGEKHQSVVSQMHPDQGRTHNVGMCPDQESN